MATPFGHSVAGYVAYKASRVANEDGPPWLLFLSVFMANAPDLDFLPGLLAGSPALYHQGISHSLATGFIVSVSAAGAYALMGWRFLPVFGLCFSSYFSHLLIDLFGPDGRSPYGIPLLWPITDRYFMSPISLFLGMHHAGYTDASVVEWLGGILQPYNLLAIAVEVTWLTPLLILTHAVLRNPRGSQPYGKPARHA
jgi:inner membrane protein